MSEINIYPLFTKLDLSLIDLFEPFKNHASTCSDFSFSNLFSWDVNDSGQVSKLNNNLIIKLPDYNNSDKFFITIIGESDVAGTVRYILNDKKFGDAISLLSEPSVRQLKNETDLAIQEDRDSFDYLYDTQAFTKLEGSDYRHFRRGLNTCISKNEQTFTFTYHAILDDNARYQCDQIVSNWGQERYDNPEYEEGLAIKKMIASSHALPVKVATLQDQNSEIIGFIIYELLEGASQAIIHFEKTTGAYPNISYLLKHSFITELARNDIATMNYEQDLGVMGLRETKLKMVPRGFNKKYTVSLK